MFQQFKLFRNLRHGFGRSSFYHAQIAPFTLQSANRIRKSVTVADETKLPCDGSKQALTEESETTSEINVLTPSQKSAVVKSLKSMTADDFSKIPTISKSHADAILRGYANKFKKFADWIAFDLDGIDEAEKYSISQAILEYKKNRESTKPKKVAGFLTPKWSSPVLPKSVVSVHMTPTKMYYLQMTSDMTVQDWKIVTLTTTENFWKFFRDNEFHNKLVKVVQEMPHSDVYLFERGIMRYKPVSGELTYKELNRLLLLKTLTFFLNCTAINKPLTTRTSQSFSSRLNGVDNDEESLLRNAVYFMKESTMSDLFNLTQGTERISVTNTVHDVMNGTNEHTTDVTIDSSFRHQYLMLRRYDEQAFGVCLLTACTFYNKLKESEFQQPLHLDNETADVPKEENQSTDQINEIDESVETADHSFSQDIQITPNNVVEPQKEVETFDQTSLASQLFSSPTPTNSQQLQDDSDNNFKKLYGDYLRKPWGKNASTKSSSKRDSDDDDVNVSSSHKVFGGQQNISRSSSSSSYSKRSGLFGEKTPRLSDEKPPLTRKEIKQIQNSWFDEPDDNVVNNTSRDDDGEVQGYSRSKQFDSGSSNLKLSRNVFGQNKQNAWGSASKSSAGMTKDSDNCGTIDAVPFADDFDQNMEKSATESSFKPYQVKSTAAAANEQPIKRSSKSFKSWCRENPVIHAYPARIASALFNPEHADKKPVEKQTVITESDTRYKNPEYRDLFGWKYRKINQR